VINFIGVPFFLILGAILIPCIIAFIKNRASQWIILAITAVLAPIIGLFGGVVGILSSLVKIGQAGQASIDAVAGPVGEALYMTAFGMVFGMVLGAALIPSVIAFKRNHAYKRTILIMQFVTPFGWIGALIWAIVGKTADKSPPLDEVFQ